MTRLQQIIKENKTLGHRVKKCQNSLKDINLSSKDRVEIEEYLYQQKLFINGLIIDIKDGHSEPFNQFLEIDDVSIFIRKEIYLLHREFRMITVEVIEQEIKLHIFNFIKNVYKRFGEAHELNILMSVLSKYFRSRMRRRLSEEQEQSRVVAKAYKNFDIIDSFYITDFEDGLRRQENIETMKKILSETEFIVIYDIFFLDINVPDLSEKMGITRQSVYNIRRSALCKIRSNIDDFDFIN